jgi:hypothetical protein
MKNVFGLPSIEEPSANGLVYQCRKPVDITLAQVRNRVERESRERERETNLLFFSTRERGLELCLE